MAKKNEQKQNPVQESDGRFFVANGKAVTCVRGILGEGEEVKPIDFRAGQKDIDAHVEIGGLVKK